MAKTPKLPRVVYPGGLTPRQHAILNAMRWQRKVQAENTPTPSEAYTIIIDFLMLMPEREVAKMAALLPLRGGSDG